MELMDFIDRGGGIMYILLFLSVAGITIMTWKFIALAIARFTLDKISEDIARTILAKKISSRNNAYILKSVKDSVFAKIKRMELGLPTVKIIASISPLLGLLGTVLGITMAFEEIGLQGLGDPKIFAKSISLALITTIGGLGVAIPHYIGYNYIVTILDKFEISIEEKVLPKVLKSK